MGTIERIHAQVQSRGLKLNPSLAPETVLAFENRHRISLPEEYREFILHIGDGGAGPPFYGLLPLGHTTKVDVPHWFASGYADYLAQPFPLTKYWMWEDEPITPAVEAAIETLRYGNLCLGHDGCGMFWLLIVSGPERGQIWNLTDVGITPPAPRCTFFQWYEYWLDGGKDWYRDFAP
jgi:hypothetical protein